MSKASLSVGVVIMSVLPLLAACAPAVLVAGAAVGMMSIHDRRSTGVQADDELTEWKARNRLPSRYADTAHINFTAFNRVLLVTGEVPDEAARREIGELAEKIEGIRKVHNELVVGQLASLSSRGNDAFISSKYTARLVESRSVSANHVKPFTEGGTLFLMGVVSDKEARAAIEIARTTDGVRKVVSLLEQLPDADIRRIDSPVAASPEEGAQAALEER